MPGHEVNFFTRRNTLGLVSDVGHGAFRGAQYGLFGNLFLTAAGYTLGGISITAMATAGAVGGAILIIPFLLLRESVEDNLANRSSNLLLTIASDTMTKGVFAAGAGLVGAAIMGIALTPVVLATLSANLALRCIDFISGVFVLAGELFTAQAEEQQDGFAVIKYA